MMSFLSTNGNTDTPTIDFQILTGMKRRAVSTDYISQDCLITGEGRSTASSNPSLSPKSQEAHTVAPKLKMRVVTVNINETEDTSEESVSDSASDYDSDLESEERKTSKTESMSCPLTG